MKSVKLLLLLCIVGLSICTESLRTETTKLATKAGAKKKEGEDTVTIQTTTTDAAGKTTQSSKTFNAGPTIIELFKELFNDPERSVNKCEMDRNQGSDEDRLNERREDELEGKGWNVPQKKRNYNWEKDIGAGLSAYFFDFLDDILFKDITVEYERVWQEAKKLQPFEGYIEPYDWYEIIRQNSGGAEPPKDENGLFAKIKSLQPTFDESAFKESITLGQVRRLLKEWNWNLDMAKNDPEKTFFDKYDYNGDGRLSPKELIIGMIKANRKVWGSIGARACKNCMEAILEKKIDPLYNYIDCSNVNMVGAETIWKNFEFLKRLEGGKFNIYSCALDTGPYRTSSVSDFVLKAQKSLEGKLTKEEFRVGILNGFWRRNVSDTLIAKDDNFSSKRDDTKTGVTNGRWTENGETDKICDKIAKAKGTA
jgi:hypothetical protein